MGQGTKKYRIGTSEEFQSTNCMKSCQDNCFDQRFPICIIAMLYPFIIGGWVSSLSVHCRNQQHRPVAACTQSNSASSESIQRMPETSDRTGWSESLTDCFSPSDAARIARADLDKSLFAQAASC